MVRVGRQRRTIFRHPVCSPFAKRIGPSRQASHVLLWCNIWSPIREKEEHYPFTTIDQLLDDFERDRKLEVTCEGNY